MLLTRMLYLCNIIIIALSLILLLWCLLCHYCLQCYYYDVSLMLLLFWCVMLRLNRVKGPSCLNKRAEGHIDNCNKDIAIMTAARTLWTIADVFIAMSFSCSVLDKCFVAGQQFGGRRGIFSFALLIEAVFILSNLGYNFEYSYRAMLIIWKENEYVIQILFFSRN